MLMDLVRLNRSYRGYDHSRKITREELLELVEAARLCPSSVNMQPLRYRLAWEEEDVAAIQKKTGWARALPKLKLPHAGKEPTAFIIICQDTKLNPDLTRFPKDVGIVAQTMLLRAVEMGLGGIMIGSFSESVIQRVAGLDETLVPMLIVAFGKPDEEIILTDVGEDGNVKYYRDEQDRHYVPKRSLEDLLIN